METAIAKAKRLTEIDLSMTVSNPEWRDLVKDLVKDIERKDVSIQLMTAACKKVERRQYIASQPPPPPARWQRFLQFFGIRPSA